MYSGMDSQDGKTALLYASEAGCTDAQTILLADSRVRLGLQPPSAPRAWWTMCSSAAELSRMSALVVTLPPPATLPVHTSILS